MKVPEKLSLDCNTLYSSIHRIHGYCYCSLFLSLFTVYTITVTVTVTASSQYSCNMNFDCLNELNNNVNGKLILGLGKLMEETASAFWVDLGYRLRSRKRVPLQGSHGVIDTLVLFLFLLYMLCMSLTTLRQVLVQRQESGPWYRVCTGPT